MTAVRIGTCSWADESLVQVWYPPHVKSAEGRLKYYAEQFDTVEVNSSYYALPTARGGGQLGPAHARRLHRSTSRRSG